MPSWIEVRGRQLTSEARVTFLNQSSCSNFPFWSETTRGTLKANFCFGCSKMPADSYGSIADSDAMPPHTLGTDCRAASRPAAPADDVTGSAPSLTVAPPRASPATNERAGRAGITRQMAAAAG